MAFTLRHFVGPQSHAEERAETLEEGKRRGEQLLLQRDPSRRVKVTSWSGLPGFLTCALKVFDPSAGVAGKFVETDEICSLSIDAG